MNTKPKGCMVLLVLAVLFISLPLLWRHVVGNRFAMHIHGIADAPAKPTAIVFGAAVYGDGRLSSVLRDRMDTAIQLYRRGIVDELLVSGDGSSHHYDEPGAMRAYAVRHGVPEEAIRVDPAGSRTYDTCYRARKLYEVQSAILVTQRFHLPRALFLCDWLDIDAAGVTADQRAYRGARWYEVREIAATMVALGDVIRQRKPAVTTLLPVVHQREE